MFGDFSRQSDDSVREANWEGWTPPWMEHAGRGPGEHGHQHAWGHGPGEHVHGFGGPGRGWGHRGWQGFRGPFFGPGRRWGQWGIPEELLALRVQAAEVARLFMIASRGAFGNKERLAQLRAFLDRSHKELAEIIYGPTSEQAQETEKQTGDAAEGAEG